MNRKSIIYLIIMILFINCSLPAYSKKNVKTKKAAANTVVNTGELYNLEWWRNYNDPVLSKLLVEAIEKNQDIKIAELRELEMKQWVKASFGRELPSVSIGPTFTRNLNSSNAYPEPAGNFFGGSWNTFKLPLNANYEIDLWRQNRQRTKAQEKLSEASYQDRRTAYLSITSSVASVYLNIIKLDKLIALEKESLALNEDRYNILKAKFEAGLSANNDVLKADQVIIDSKNNLTAYEKQRDMLLNELAVLTGQSPVKKQDYQMGSIDDMQIFYEVPGSLSSDKVLNRPDILKAEALLEESKINVSIARKEFLPKISLSGFIGYNSIKLSNLFSWDSFITGIGTSMLQSIFTGGQRRAKLKAYKFKYEQMIQQYQKTFFTALQELNNSMVSLKSDIKTNEEYLEKIIIENKNIDLIRLKYDKGLIPRLVLVENQQNLIRLQQQQIIFKTDCLIDLISLYKSTGGAL